MKKIVGYIIGAVVVAIVLVFIGLVGTTKQGSVPIVPSPTPVDNNAFPPRISNLFLSNKEDGYPIGGVVALSSVAEPMIYVSGENLTAPTELTVYRADEQTLLNFLTHNKAGAQIKAKPDLNKLQKIATLQPQPETDGKATKVILPLEKTGIWFLRAQSGDLISDMLLVRSNIAALVKEGDNELIFWAQDFTTHRSLNAGTVTTYNMLSGANSIAEATINAEGIAKTAVSLNTDIAIVRLNQDISLVPINQKYINSESYRPFEPKRKESTFFTFIDRPIYKPGDTIYYKSILRDDDDVRYSIPVEPALVQVFKDYNDGTPIYEKRQPVSADGTVSGEVKLKSDSPTGSYTVKISLPTTADNLYWRNDSVYFSVENYRKPEYSIDVSVAQTELISKDRAVFTVSGQYFFGQPLSGQKIKYAITAADYNTYQYYQPAEIKDSLSSDNYRYGFWGGKKVKEGEVVLDKNGKAEVEIPTEITDGTTKAFSIQATIDDGSGNPSFSRKNVLVYAGGFNIYRTDGWSYTGVDQVFSLPMILVPLRGEKIGGVELRAEVHREDWLSYQEEGKKYPSYRKVEEDLAPLKVRTNEKGEAVFAFTPKKTGQYSITVSGKDKSGNLVSKKFHTWVNKEGMPLYREFGNEITIQADRENYLPTDTVSLNVVSNSIVDRDVFLSLERARVNRFEVVHLAGKSGTVKVPLVETDIPNIYAEVAGFSESGLDTSTAEINVSTTGKKIIVNIAPDKEKYGPGETVTLNVSTTDNAGNPLSTETAVWAVDKALFELADERAGTAFDFFWRERYDGTETAHSLEGISGGGAEKGGCFTEDTLVLMQDGSEKKIKDVQPGDFILTRVAEKQSTLVPAKVTGVHSEKTDGYLIINGTLKVTVNHRLFVNNAWQEAGGIQIGDALTDVDGKAVKVVSIEWQRGLKQVYNLTVDKYQTYFANKVYVHNQKGDSRTVFKDTAYWNPSVQTDVNGRAQVRFKLPDNLTTWRVSAVSSTKDTKLGNGSKEILVTKDVIIRPLLPNILRQGDEVKMEAMVQNFTGVQQKLEASLEMPEVKIVSAPRVDVSLKPGESTTVAWQVTAEKVNPGAKAVFAVRSKADGKMLDGMAQELPVFAFGFNEKRAETGFGTKNYSIRLAPDTDKERTTISLALSPSILGTLPQTMKYLLYYPYGCVEQTTSAMVPAIIAKLHPEYFSEALKEVKVDENIKKGLDRLAKLQQMDGGWNWWSSGNSDPFVTAYVTEYLIKAQEAGVAVDSVMLGKARAFLERPQTILKSDSKEVSLIKEKEKKVFKAYILSLLGTEKTTDVITDFSGLSSDVLSMAIMANVKNGELNPATNGLAVLLAQGKKRGDGMYWESGSKANFGSDDASTALALRAIMAAGDSNSLLASSARLLAIARKNDYWTNTFATAQVIRALTDMAEITKENTADFNYSVSLDGKELAGGVVNATSNVLSEVIVPAMSIKNAGSQLAITKTGEGNLYSTIVINEFRRDKQARAEEHGLTITREYVSEKGEGKPLQVGDLVTVRLKVDGLRSEELYAVIDDKLPAGLIPVNTSLKNEQFAENNQSYFDSVDRDYGVDGVVIYPYRLKAGEETFTYQARVVSEGTFLVPPATISLMYLPEIGGRSAVQTVKTFNDVNVPIVVSNNGKTEKTSSTKLGNYFGFAGLVILVAAVIGAIALLIGRKSKQGSDSSQSPPSNP